MFTPGAPLREGDKGVQQFLGLICRSSCPLWPTFLEFLSIQGPIFYFLLILGQFVQLSALELLKRGFLFTVGCQKSDLGLGQDLNLDFATFSSP